MNGEFDDLGFDPIDTELGSRLRAVAPAADDTDAVLAGLRPQLVRARRRRQTGFVAVGAAALVLLAGVAFAVVDTTPRRSVNVPPANHSRTVTTTPTPDTTPVTVAEIETADDNPTPATESEPATSPAVGSPKGGSSASSESDSGSGTGAGTVTPPTTIDDHGSDDSSEDGGSGSGGGGGSSGHD